MTTQPTAEQRITESMGNRAEYLAGLYAVIDGSADTFAGDYPDAPETLTDEDARERIDQLALGASTYRVLRVELSTGGPADYITAKLDGNRVESAQYHFADWFDHAERTISEDSPLWRYVEEIADILPADEIA